MTFVNYSYLNTDLIIGNSKTPDRLQQLLEAKGLLVVDATPTRLVFEVVNSTPEADLLSLATALRLVRETLCDELELGEVTFDIGFSSTGASSSVLSPMEVTISRAAVQAVVQNQGALCITIYPASSKEGES